MVAVSVGEARGHEARPMSNELRQSASSMCASAHASVAAAFFTPPAALSASPLSAGVSHGKPRIEELDSGEDEDDLPLTKLYAGLAAKPNSAAERQPRASPLPAPPPGFVRYSTHDSTA